MPARWHIPAAGAAALLLCIGAFAAIGQSADALASLSAALYTTIRSGGPALAYLLAGAGYGRLFARAIGASPHAAALQTALGLGFLLTLSHALGIFGLLSGPAAVPVGLGSIVIGLALLGHQLLRRGPAVAAVSPAWLLAIPAIALLIVAACQPPGWLWDSEAGGYDSLSYHLQLPQEWLARGRIAPLDHNFFSYLPSYIEASYLHIAALMGLPSTPSAASPATGLLAGDGYGAIACQFLGVGIALVTAWFLAALARAACGYAGVDSPATSTLAAITSLCTPWVIVTGSLAYNDLAAVAFLAAAALAAVDRSLAPLARGVLVGILTAAACNAKPTALIFGAPGLALALAATSGARRSLLPLAGAAAAGAVWLLPWLIRNWAASGNPVFPQAASVFGSGHWSAEQVTRFTDAVTFHGSLVDRLKLLVVIDPSDPSGPRHRGMLHPQWFALFPAVIAAGALALLRPATHRAAALCVAVLGLQLLAWLFFTHLQSRFLLPLIIPATALVALAAATLTRPRHVGPSVLALAAIVQLSASIWTFATQRGGIPNQLLLSGPSIRSGEAFRAELAATDPLQARQFLSDLPPEPFINLALPPGGSVYLLGDATPFYYSYPVIYNTTWDAWPLAEAIRAAPNDPAAWTRALHGRGIRFVLANYAEIDRLTRSGWIDPRITPQAVDSWLRTAGRPIRQWPTSVLVELLPSAPEPIR